MARKRNYGGATTRDAAGRCVLLRRERAEGNDQSPFSKAIDITFGKTGTLLNTDAAEHQ
jgi:hypothetical protein